MKTISRRERCLLSTHTYRTGRRYCLRDCRSRSVANDGDVATGADGWRTGVAAAQSASSAARERNPSGLGDEPYIHLDNAVRSTLQLKLINHYPGMRECRVNWSHSYVFPRPSQRSTSTSTVFWHVPLHCSQLSCHIYTHSRLSLLCFAPCFEHEC